MLSVLETLMAAKARIENPRTEWEFTDWTACTCGHIYTAARGRKATDIDFVSHPTNRAYADTIVACARALGWDGQHEDDTREGAAASFVSDYTSENSDPSHDDIERADAVAVLDRAIAAIQAQDEANRQAVLAAAAAIVDNAPRPTEAIPC